MPLVSGAVDRVHELDVFVTKLCPLDCEDAVAHGTAGSGMLWYRTGHFDGFASGRFRPVVVNKYGRGRPGKREINL